MIPQGWDVISGTPGVDFQQGGTGPFYVESINGVTLQQNQYAPLVQGNYLFFIDAECADTVSNFNITLVQTTGATSSIFTGAARIANKRERMGAFDNKSSAGGGVVAMRVQVPAGARLYAAGIRQAPDLHHALRAPASTQSIATGFGAPTTVVYPTHFSSQRFASSYDAATGLLTVGRPAHLSFFAGVRLLAVGANKEVRLSIWSGTDEIGASTVFTGAAASNDVNIQVATGPIQMVRNTVVKVTCEHNHGAARDITGGAFTFFRGTETMF